MLRRRLRSMLLFATLAASAAAGAEVYKHVLLRLLDAPPAARKLSLIDLHKRFPALRRHPLNERAAGIGVTAGMISLAGSWWGVMNALGEKRKDGLHGTAQWASAEDLDRVGIRSIDVSLLGTGEDALGRGVIVGMFQSVVRGSGRSLRVRSGKLVVDCGQNHVGIIAPTGAGKSSCLVIPTLCEYRGSVIVLDVKGELWEKTSGCRGRFSRVVRYDPSSTMPGLASINPLLLIPEDETLELAAGQLADAVVIGDPDFWTSSAKAVIQAGIIHTLAVEKDKTLGGLYDQLTDPDLDFAGRLQVWLDQNYRLPGMTSPGVHPAVRSQVGNLLSGSENTVGGVMMTAVTALKPFSDLAVQRSLRGLDIAPADFENECISLYITIPPGRMGQVRGMVRGVLYLFFSQMVAGKDGRFFDEEGRPLLMLLDEIPQLGRMEFLEQLMGVVRSYGLRVAMAAQDDTQFKALYGQYETFTTHFKSQAAFAPSEIGTAERLSKMTGTSTILTERRSESSGRSGASTSLGEEHLGRPLLTPDEVLRYPDVLFFATGCPAAQLERARYFTSDHWLRETAREPMVSPLPRRELPWGVRL